MWYLIDKRIRLSLKLASSQLFDREPVNNQRTSLSDFVLQSPNPQIKTKKGAIGAPFLLALYNKALLYEWRFRHAKIKTFNVCIAD